MNPKNYKAGDKRMVSNLKKKLGFNKDDELRTGDMLERLNEKKKLAMRGLI
jgi:hypothetical protein